MVEAVAVQGHAAAESIRDEAHEDTVGRSTGRRNGWSDERIVPVAHGEVSRAMCRNGRRQRNDLEGVRVKVERVRLVRASDLELVHFTEIEHRFEGAHHAVVRAPVDRVAFKADWQRTRGVRSLEIGEIARAGRGEGLEWEREERRGASEETTARGATGTA
jgi:hypothetical protein